MNILINDAKIGTLSDIDGNYKLDISAEFDTSETVLIQYSALGYSSQEVLFTKPMLQVITKYDVQFKEVLLNVMGVATISRRQQYSPTGLWWRFKRAFR